MPASTVKGVEKLLRAGTTGDYSAGRGLYLKVSGKAKGSWFYRFMLDGKRRRMGLGSFETTTLAQAGALRDAAAKLVSEGIDPLERRKANKQEQSAAVVYSSA